MIKVKKSAHLTSRYDLISIRSQIAIVYNILDSKTSRLSDRIGLETQQTQGNRVGKHLSVSLEPTSQTT